MLFVTKGNAYFGEKKVDADGNIIKETPAHFDTDENGCCVAIGQFDEDTTELKINVQGLYGDWDAAGYLGAILEMLKPQRQVNLPDFKAIFKTALENGENLCKYCQKGFGGCRDCIVNQWTEE